MLPELVQSWTRSVPANELARARSTKLLVVASVFTLAVTGLLVTTIVMWSVGQADSVTSERQGRILAAALSRSIDNVSHDQESIAIWDDAVRHLQPRQDRDWLRKNIGDWMLEYFKHDFTYLIGPENSFSFAYPSENDADLEVSISNQDIIGLVATLRGTIAESATDKYLAGEEPVPRLVERIMIGGRPTIVSVMPIVAETEALAEPSGHQTIIVSGRFLDKDFVQELAQTYQLAAARYSASSSLESDERSFPLLDTKGSPVGYFIWKPQLPSWAILPDVLRVLAAGFLAVGAATAFLVFKLRSAHIQLLASEAHAKHLAFHDSLTGLPNRVHFEDQLKAAMELQTGNPARVALLFLDLDRFKLVNDTLGHAAGDELIRDLAVRLTPIVPHGSSLARIGGDEFAIVIPKVTDEKTIDALCRDIHARTGEAFYINGSPAVVGISIGVALGIGGVNHHTELARQADVALYSAKHAGRHRTHTFTPAMSERLRKEHELVAELVDALDNTSTLEIVYQPIFTSYDPRAIGFEALLRWNHPRLGHVRPQELISIAEENGLIDRLGHWVLLRACRAATQWRSSTISVNASPLQIVRPGYAASVLAVLAETGLAAERLEIEITESVLLDASGAADQALHELREAGVRIAIDDFGTGYSSLSYLTRHPVDRIKIDKSFVQQLGSKQTSTIVAAIIAMARAVGLSVTAEGVETVAQLDTLRTAGCNAVQGFLLSQPLSQDAASALLLGGGAPSAEQRNGAQAA